MQVTVYTAGPACQKCRLTERALEAAGIPFNVTPLNDHAEKLAKLHNLQSAPVVVAGDLVWDDFRPDRIAAIKEFMALKESA